MCLLSYNQVQIPFTKACPQQNLSLIKGFRDCTAFPYPLPLENMLLPNSFTHASYTHQQYNCSGNEREKAANQDGNNISNPSNVPPSLLTITTISRHMHAQTPTHGHTNAEHSSAQLSFLVGLIRVALCQCAAGTLEAQRWSTGISPTLQSEAVQSYS